MVTKCVSTLVSDRAFLEQTNDIIEIEFFDGDAHQWIVKETVSYFQEYKTLPTLNVFKTRVDSIVTEVLKHSVIDTLKSVYTFLGADDLTFVKSRFLEFCKNQKISNAIMSSVDFLGRGEYDKIKTVVDEAMKAGMERKIGHEYMLDIEDRMSEMARDTIKTHWGPVDGILDGGLAPGELGIIVAPSGAGKCVGPNTEIEIEYHEIGVEVTGNSGNSLVIWINPFNKYDLGYGEVFGWQVENVIYEIESRREDQGNSVT
jgi:hypothetical protein